MNDYNQQQNNQYPSQQYQNQNQQYQERRYSNQMQQQQQQQQQNQFKNLNQYSNQQPNQTQYTNQNQQSTSPYGAQPSRPYESFSNGGDVTSHYTNMSMNTNNRPMSGEGDARLMPLKSPPIDEMAPQSISFIGDENEEDIQTTSRSPYKDQNNEMEALSRNINSRLHITSGSRTYRIPSPTRPSVLPKDNQNSINEKGFYISFEDNDNKQPKRPKPPLRAKRTPSTTQSQQHSNNNSMQNNNTHQMETKTNDKFNKDVEMLAAELDRERVIVRDKRETLSAEPNRNTNQNDVNRDKSHDQPTPAALIIGTDLANPDPDSVDEMERKKEKIMLLSLRRRQKQDEDRAKREADLEREKEKERAAEEEKSRRKEEQARRRQEILDRHRLKKAIEEAEREGKVIDKNELMHSLKITTPLNAANQTSTTPRLRTKTNSSSSSTIGSAAGGKPRQRPKTIHIDSQEISDSLALVNSRGKKGSSSNLSGIGSQSGGTIRRDYYRGSQDSLSYRESPEDAPSRSTSQGLGRRGSYKTSRDTDSGLGRATPPRRAPSPGVRHLPSPSGGLGPGSLPPSRGLYSSGRRGGPGSSGGFDDAASDVSSAAGSLMMDHYNGPRLYKQPLAKSNRNIMLNAVEYCVFPGAVNETAKRRVLDEMMRSECKHFLILFRDAGCQFRALYGYDTQDGEMGGAAGMGIDDKVIKLYGTGPKVVDDKMFDKFFKYNSGGKCFSQVHTKHLTVTIDAFTIHNSLWQGKKVNLPNKRDMTLVI
ncbi:patronin-like isoform X2 [Ctenocephalides felis]|uniref:patronin-like isoform X2 n=1 Tax=Ctenocephalides felis TaxID=7515 RepID=UPI000E6E1297|nr:patronin-like isoform X2 [Ctenocephalides felis]